jgi:hypothetical protein
MAGYAGGRIAGAKARLTESSNRGGAAILFGLIAIALALAVTGGASVSYAFEIKQAGKLTVAHSARLMAFSTDPTFQQVLSEDFSAARRGPTPVSGSILTVTVTVSQKPLRPGVSLNDVAPGDPQVADLIKAAGATPPPIGDTGNQYDEAAYARQLAARNQMPSDTPMEQMIQQFGSGYDSEAGIGMMGPPLPCASRSVVTPGCPPPVEETPDPQPGNPGYTGDVKAYMGQGQGLSSLLGHHGSDRAYDMVIVARAAVTGETEEMTIVSVIHPGEDPHDAKKLMAEKIADSILH